jgi:hypothetical protein
MGSTSSGFGTWPLLRGESFIRVAAAAAAATDANDDTDDTSVPTSPAAHMSTSPSSTDYSYALGRLQLDQTRVREEKVQALVQP